jgi:hypothetical protein
MTEELAIGDFLFRQRRLASDERISRRYDVIVAGLSWESRSTVALARLDDPATAITLLKFRSRSSPIEKAKERQLTAFGAILSSVIVKDLDSSTEAQKNFLLLKSWFQDLYSAADRPLSVLVDVTCIPKTYVLYLIGLGFSDELFARFDCLYTPGVYDLISSNSTTPPAVAGPRAILSEGEWCSRQIPYLEASDYIANDIDLLVTFGGELGLSLPFIERYEPRRLGMIFIKETAPSASASMLASERHAYEELLREPNAEQEDIELCDALSVARHAVRFASASHARGITAMAIGSKSHALGLGVAALADPRIEVVCRMPASYRPVDVAPIGHVMLYEIEDRFDPASYIAPS